MSGLGNEITKLANRGADGAVPDDTSAYVDHARGRDVDHRAVNVVTALRLETENARSLLANMRDILGDDADLIATTIEGETDLNSALDRAVRRVFELDGLINGLGDMVASLKSRSDRLDNQRELLRAAICAGMDAAGQKRIEFPIATVSLTSTPRKPIIDDESSVPLRFWKAQPPKLDRKALTDALKSDETIPGARLDNGGMTVTIRSK